jgi:SAM-dependent methyltransferase
VTSEPYFTVLTDPRFLRANLTEESRAEFFRSGDALVDFLVRTIQLRLAPDFAPTAILDYGCGPGRLAVPLARLAARRGGTVTAVDRSPRTLVRLVRPREHVRSRGLADARRRRRPGHDVPRVP